MGGQRVPEPARQRMRELRPTMPVYAIADLMGYPYMTVWHNVQDIEGPNGWLAKRDDLPSPHWEIHTYTPYIHNAEPR